MTAAIRLDRKLLETRLSLMAQSLKDCQAERVALESSLQAVAARAGELEADLRVSQEECQSLRARAAESEPALRELTGQLDRLRVELQLCVSCLELEQAAAKEAEQRVEELSFELAHLRKQVDASRRENDLLAKRLREALRLVAQGRARERTLGDRAESATRACQELRDRLRQREGAPPPILKPGLEDKDAREPAVGRDLGSLDLSPAGRQASLVLLESRRPPAGNRTTISRWLASWTEPANLQPCAGPAV